MWKTKRTLFYLTVDGTARWCVCPVSNARVSRQNQHEYTCKMSLKSYIWWCKSYVMEKHTKITHTRIYSIYAKHTAAPRISKILYALYVQAQEKHISWRFSMRTISKSKPIYFNENDKMHIVIDIDQYSAPGLIHLLLFYENLLKNCSLVLPQCNCPM